MSEVTNYFIRKGFEIWNDRNGDVEGTKGIFYLNIIKNSEGYLVIMSIRGQCRFAHKQVNQLDEHEIRVMYNRMKNCEIYRVPDMTDSEFAQLGMSG
jgi:hypothetical protein